MKFVEGYLLEFPSFSHFVCFGVGEGKEMYFLRGLVDRKCIFGMLSSLTEGHIVADICDEYNLDVDLLRRKLLD